MRRTREIRREAWTALWKDNWFWRLFAVSALLGFVTGMVVLLVQTGFALGEVTDLGGYLGQIREARENGGVAPAMTPALGLHIAGATLFLWFIVLVFVSCAQFGVSSVQLKAARGQTGDWGADVFAGYRRPLGLFVQSLLQILIILFWTLCLVVPGVIAFYRNRQTMFIRADRPDQGAVDALCASGRLMRGAKWRLFCLDSAFLGYALALVVLEVLAESLVKAAGGAVSALMEPVLALCLGAAGVVLGQYFGLAQAIFYRDLVNEKGAA